MKTFHRIMYENLTPEEWKELLKVDLKKCRGKTPYSGLDASDKNYIVSHPDEALRNFFIWSYTEQGHQYWYGVWKRLHKKECVRVSNILRGLSP